MTATEYQAARDRLIGQLATPQTIHHRDGRSVTNRPIKDIQAAIAALDAEWQRSQGSATARIGRMYFSGEGK